MPRALTDEPLTAQPGPSLKASSKAERERAWRALYHDQFDRIYRLVYRCGVRSAEVEDVVQQVFTIAYRKIDSHDPLRNPGNWLYGIALRVVRDHHRWYRVRRVKQALLEATVGAEHGAAQGLGKSPRASAEATQTQARIAAALARMSPKLREVLVLTDIEECGLDEAAAILDVPKNTVRSRRQRARESFQKIWRQHAPTEEQHGPNAH
ncbi:MAG: RNA polymerase sigma factor [Haliangiales bacterium]